MSRIAHPAWRFGAVALAIVVLLTIGVMFFPWNVLRGPVAAHFAHRLNRPVTIGGDLHVKLGLPLRVEADDVTVANVSWSDAQPMARAKAVVLWYPWRSLLHLAPDRVDFVEPHVVLERNANGENNWHFGSNGAQGPPLLAAIGVDRGELRYRDAKLPGDVTLAVQSAPVNAQGESPLQFAGNGTLRGDALELTGVAGGFSALRHLDDPYPLAFDLVSGATRIHFDGTVVPSAPQNMQGALRLAGADLSKLYPIVPSPLPWTPPYTLSGQLVHGGTHWQFTKISGKVGSSDLAGEFTIDLSGPRAATRADLASRKLDYKDLGGFVGLPPGEPGRRAKTREQRQEANRRAASERVLPDTPFDFAKLREHDVDLNFKGTSVTWGRFPLDDLAVHMTLAHGTLRLEPLDFGIADGHVLTRLVVDLGKSPAEASGDAEVRRVELKRIFPQLAAPGGSAGRVGGRAHLSASGNDVAELMASMNGEAALAMRGGEMSTLHLVLTNLDLARAAALLMRGRDEKAQLRCAVAAMHITRGVIVPDLLVVDSEAELIHGAGSIDFADERYDVSLKADSKKPSLLALRGPILVSGTFKHPVVRPALGQPLARVGAAIGLGLIAPPLALLPLIDLGNAPDANCAALYRDANVATTNAHTTHAKEHPHASNARPTADRLARSR